MTFEQAKELLIRSDILRGKEYKGKIIDGMAIVPNDLSNLYLLVKHAAENQNDTEGFEALNDFITVALLGYSMFRETGHLEYEDVRVILDEMQN